MFAVSKHAHFRCLKSIDQSQRFHALVGPNARAADHILDVIALLGELIRNRGEVIDTVQAQKPRL